MIFAMEYSTVRTLRQTLRKKGHLWFDRRMCGLAYSVWIRLPALAKKPTKSELHEQNRALATFSIVAREPTLDWPPNFRRVFEFVSGNEWF